jgi:hypothetical protein
VKSFTLMFTLNDVLFPNLLRKFISFIDHTVRFVFCFSRVCPTHVTRFVRLGSLTDPGTCALRHMVIKNYLDCPEIGRINRVKNSEYLSDLLLQFVAMQLMIFLLFDNASERKYTSFVAQRNLLKSFDFSYLLVLIRDLQDCIFIGKSILIYLFT